MEQIHTPNMESSNTSNSSVCPLQGNYNICIYWLLQGNCYMKYSFSPHLQWPHLIWILVNFLSWGQWNSFQQKQYSEEQASLLSPKPYICNWKFLGHLKYPWEKKRDRKTFLLPHDLNVHPLRTVSSNWFYLKISNKDDTFHKQLNKIF